MDERDSLHTEGSSSVSVKSASDDERQPPVEEAVEFEEFMTALAAMPDGRVDEGIETAMSRLLDRLDLEHCAVFQRAADGEHLRLTHHQRRAGMPEPPSEISAGTGYPWILSRVLAGKVVYVESLDDLPSEADRDSIYRWGATSFVAFPLTIDGVASGAVCFSVAQPGRTPARLDRLCLVAHVFGTVLGRQRAHAALHSCEQRVQTIADQTQMMIWTTGPDKRPTWFNRQWLEFVGHALDEEIRSGRTASVHPDDLASWVETYETSFDARRPFTMEYRLRRCDGEWRWVLDNGAPNFAGDEFAGYVGTCLDITEHKASLEEVVRLRDELHRENVTLKREVKERRGFDTIVGESEAIRAVLAEVERVAATDATVLLLGETGTGKELFATRIHELSARRGRTMVRVNCAAIPPTLIESELFGREKGAFTGALARQIGRFELADHSTIFLDEIGDLPVDVQVKLLRVLEERQIERLGSPRADPHRHADHRRHSPGPRETRRRRHLPRGSLLPAQRVSHPRFRRCVSASRTSRRWCGGSSSTSRKALGKRIDTIPQQTHAGAAAVSVAGQRPRTAQRRRTRR